MKKLQKNLFKGNIMNITSCTLLVSYRHVNSVLMLCLSIMDVWVNIMDIKTCLKFGLIL